jgi:hypothetical protein
LPVELRDKFIPNSEVVEMPTNIANRDYWANNMNAAIEQLDLPYNKPEVIAALQKVSDRHTGGQGAKSHNRNLAHVCSFFV